MKATARLPAKVGLFCVSAGVKPNISGHFLAPGLKRTAVGSREVTCAWNSTRALSRCWGCLGLAAAPGILYLAPFPVDISSQIDVNVCLLLQHPNVVKLAYF